MRVLVFFFALAFLVRLAAAQNLPPPVYSPDLATKAEDGDPVAQLEIGRCFASGVGVPKNEVQARQWWEKSAGGGNLDALRLLRVEGKNLWSKSSGYTVPLVSTPEELSQLEEKADEGDPDSLYRLGLMYVVGFPQIPRMPKIELDEPKGRKLMQEAAEAGYGPAQLWLGNFYFQMAQNNEDSAYHKLAWNYFIQAAEAGDPQGQLSVACMLGRGEGVARDPAQAVFWLRKSAEQGYFAAMRNLAMCYLVGEGTPSNDRDASLWFQKYYQITSENSKKAREKIMDLQAKQKEKSSL